MFLSLCGSGRISEMSVLRKRRGRRVGRQCAGSCGGVVWPRIAANSCAEALLSALKSLSAKGSGQSTIAQWREGANSHNLGPTRPRVLTTSGVNLQFDIKELQRTACARLAGIIKATAQADGHARAARHSRVGSVFSWWLQHRLQ